MRHNAVQTEHGEELLRVEVLHSPLSLEVMCLGKHVVVERRLSAERVNDPQQTASNQTNIQMSGIVVVVVVEMNII